MTPNVTVSHIQWSESGYPVRMEDETEDPVGCTPPRDPSAKFRALAEDAGLTVDDALIAYSYALVEFAACLVEPFGDAEAGGNAGEALRAELGEH